MLFLRLIGNKISFRPIRSVIILVINKSDSRCAVVRFCNHSYDYRPNWIPLSPITITNLCTFHKNSLFAMTVQKRMNDSEKSFLHYSLGTCLLITIKTMLQPLKNFYTNSTNNNLKFSINFTLTELITT